MTIVITVDLSPAPATASIDAVADLAEDRDMEATPLVVDIWGATVQALAGSVIGALVALVKFLTRLLVVGVTIPAEVESYLLRNCRTFNLHGPAESTA